MILRITEPEIIKEVPFHNDKLDRKQSAIVLTELFSNIEGPFVMSLNSPWGAGKTTFIKMLKQHLLNEGFPSIYFNAWETDYQDNPLLTFITEITIKIKTLETDGFEVSKLIKLREKVFETGKVVVKKALPTALKIATHGILDFDKDFKEIEKSIADFSSDVAKDALENCADTKQIVEAFKKQLKELIDQLQKNSPNEKRKPLIFFIDELDRCRPDYAIQILEKVKHFFDIDGIIFVLGIDMRQLNKAVRVIYGYDDQDVPGYIKKFIDLEYNLTNDSITIENYCKYLAYSTHITKDINSTKESNNSLNQLYESAYICSYSYNFSLRDINQLFSNAYLIFLTYGNRLQAHHVSLTVILLSIRMYDHELFHKILKKQISVIELLEILHTQFKQPPNIDDFDDYFLILRLRLLSLKTISAEKTDEILNRLHKTYYINQPIEQFKKKTIEKENEYTHNRYFTDLIFKKLKLLDSFNIPEEGK